MKHPIRTPEDLGLIIRAVRKSTAVRQDDLAGAAHVSRQFAVNVEKGKPTVQIGLVFKLLEELGIGLHADIPEAASQALSVLKVRRDSKRRANGPARARRLPPVGS